MDVSAEIQSPGLWDANFEAAILDQGVEPRPAMVMQQPPRRRKLVSHHKSWDGLVLIQSATTNDNTDDLVTSTTTTTTKGGGKSLVDHLLMQPHVKQACQDQVASTHKPPKTLQQKLCLAEMDRVSLKLQVLSLQEALADKDKELLTLRIESMDELAGSDRGGDHIKVPLEEWRGLHTARDTAMTKAGELAVELATCRADKDDLQEQLEVKEATLVETAKELQLDKVKMAKLEARLAKYEPKDASYGPRSWMLRRIQSTSSSSASVSVASTTSDDIDSTGTMSCQSSFLGRLRGGRTAIVKDTTSSLANGAVPDKVSFVLSEHDDGSESDNDEFRGIPIFHLSGFADQ